MSEFVTHRRVEFAHTDMAGIVHFANFYRWMEEVEHEYFRSRGLNIMVRNEDGSYIGWPRVSASCHFEAPAHHNEQLEIRLRVERVGVKSLTLYFEFWHDGRRLAHGRMKTACCICRPNGTLESIEIPDTYRNQFEDSMAG